MYYTHSQFPLKVRQVLVPWHKKMIMLAFRACGMAAYPLYYIGNINLSEFSNLQDSQTIKASTLFVAATPIGNLGDATPRLKNALLNADLVACEDTRVTGKLLEKLEIPRKKLVSYHDKNEIKRAEEIITLMTEQTMNVVLVSDAGTPCVSDPGYRMVDLAHKNAINVVPIVGASAMLALLMCSGLPSDRFSFVGFLPHKVEARKKEISSWSKLGGSTIFYETATRITDSLKIIETTWPNSKVAIGRELTKTFEEVIKLSISEAQDWVEEKKRTHSLKGEFVLMVSGFNEVKLDHDAVGLVEKLAAEEFAAGKSHKQLMKEFSHYPIERQALYNLLLKVKKSRQD